MLDRTRTTWRTTARWPLVLAWLVLLCGCDIVTTAAPTSAPRPVPTLFPTSARPAAPPATDTSAPADTGWQLGSPGVELRHVQASAGALVVVRLDPARVRLRVAYAPENPRGLGRWFAETRPLAVINGGFFTKEYRATALLISDGAPSGESYEGFGGMLAVAPDGGVSIRPLRDQPYDASEPLDQAMQSFPMLVFPGGTPAEIEDNGERSRRSVLAIDRDGRLLLIVGPGSGFTLPGLAQWLAQSDLAIDRALNLDGGSSTGLYLRAGELSESIDSFGPLPIVLLIEARA
ncbi:MAG TPA: phosphodiester glycosidase family protein [Kouleothrix sp.]|uniref:phosphodiester glycosidase family protein n=1 Tax=Kouleothrix sp. TaxID=2779161 RepID=UPI002C462A6F|nr:phosphodiester glycosidase family protein [Kouleothrix sp.]HRC77006.1 phosphodiester glycosidase family protein [Kouleothrix sp.]